MTIREAYKQTVETWRFKAGIRRAEYQGCGFCSYADDMRERYGYKRNRCYYCPLYKALGMYCEYHVSYERWWNAWSPEGPNTHHARNVLRALRRLGKKKGWDK